MYAELLWATPFVLLLGSIAVLPLVRKHWWEHNFPFLSLALALIVIFHFIFQLRDVHSLLHTGIEYLSFICLIGSLFVVSGGIHITVKGEATPVVNTLFLLIGGVIANLLGTTGASMVLIRPWLRMNKYRLTAHHIVFFIFIVSNVGGCLTPIGDPPLFLGFLQGIPFFWVAHNLWPMWAMATGLLLAVFFVWDSLNFRRAPKAVRESETAHEEWRFQGLHNVLFLAMILGSVFVNKPHFLREAIMVVAAVLSYFTTPKPVHEANDFSFGPIKEVAILFFGIFATMIPALHWLEKYSSQLGIQTVGQFYWGTGVLSSVLDNAPTYLNFISAAIGLFGAEGLGGKAAVTGLLATHPEYIRAISVGAVFFGAMTYIGNGPNFLVKSIADQQKAHTPGFFGYIVRFALPVLLPIFFLVWLVFFQ
jgi:Na+/H+ antiporter NhaD/arsenite permease-like protein